VEIRISTDIHSSTVNTGGNEPVELEGQYIETAAGEEICLSQGYDLLLTIEGSREKREKRRRRRNQKMTY